MRFDFKCSIIHLVIIWIHKWLDIVSTLYQVILGVSDDKYVVETKLWANPFEKKLWEINDDFYDSFIILNYFKAFVIFIASWYWVS